MRYSWKATAAGFVLVSIAAPFVDGQLAGLLLRVPDQTQLVEHAPTPVHFNTVSSSSTNAVIGVDAPTGW